MAISGLSFKNKRSGRTWRLHHDLARCRFQSGVPNQWFFHVWSDDYPTWLWLPWDFDGPNRNRWFTELNSMVDLSMANCLLNNQMVLIMQFCDKAIEPWVGKSCCVCFPRFFLSIPALGRCIHLSATQPDISYKDLQFRQQISVRIWLKGISGTYMNIS